MQKACLEHMGVPGVEKQGPPTGPGCSAAGPHLSPLLASSKPATALFCPHIIRQRCCYYSSLCVYLLAFLRWKWFPLMIWTTGPTLRPITSYSDWTTCFHLRSSTTCGGHWDAGPRRTLVPDWVPGESQLCPLPAVLPGVVTHHSRPRGSDVDRHSVPTSHTTATLTQLLGPVTEQHLTWRHAS